MSTLGKTELHKLMASICTAGSLAESFALYKIAATHLTKCKFVFAAKSGGTPGFAVNRTFSANGAVRSLFSTDKVIVLDEDTFQAMETGTAIYPLDYSISLDTQALSYLEPFLRGSTSCIPGDFKEVFEFIARKDVLSTRFHILLRTFPISITPILLIAYSLS